MRNRPPDSLCTFDYRRLCEGLARGLEARFLDHRRLSFGVETVADYGGDRLFFRVDPAVVARGVTWLFPIAGRSRIGIASYRGDSGLKAGLRRFLDSLGLRADGFHGGFFPWRVRGPTVREIFSGFRARYAGLPPRRLDVDRRR